MGHLDKNMEDLKVLKEGYYLLCLSRQISLLGRKEVFMGKAKFGIFGDGKELAQWVMSCFFKAGDFRAGYYRDQTFMLATGLLTAEQFFAQLYADTHPGRDLASSGRMMTAHFGYPLLDEEGNFYPQTNRKNVTADISCTGGQMPRLLGLAYASKLYRVLPSLHGYTDFSHQGNEVAWGTIGNASTSEGVFFEVFNAAAVLQVPMVLSVWDDAYGISVPASYHTAGGSISKVLSGYKRKGKREGWSVYEVKGWDYASLRQVYAEASERCEEGAYSVLWCM